MDIDVEKFIAMAGQISAVRTPRMVQAKVLPLVPIAQPTLQGRDRTSDTPWQGGWMTGAAPTAPLRIAGVRFRRLA